jgi:hypothetical protein
VTAVLLLSLMAFGQEESGEETEAPAVIEVVVYGELLVEQARQQLEDDLREAGYARAKVKEDRVIYRHPSVWKGEVHVYEDGWFRTRRQRLKFEAIEVPWAENGSPLAIAGCVVYSFLCFRPGGVLISERKFRAQETRIVEHIHEDAEVWAERISDLATDRKVEDLPDAFEDLWSLGAPLMGGEHLATMTDRRMALLAYWDSRTDTPWGETVRQAVEAFCRGVVQHSHDPFTDAEIAEFNERRRAIRPFSLEKPIVGR